VWWKFPIATLRDRAELGATKAPLFCGRGRTEGDGTSLDDLHHAQQSALLAQAERAPRRCARHLAIACVALMASARAMDLKRIDHTLILSGVVVQPDLDRITKEFATQPAITHVVLRNSMGGNSWTGYRLGELFRKKGVTTAVSGHCVSSCSRLFLGGKTRMFSDDFPASLTYVGFHGHYDFDKLNRAAVEKDDLAGWTMKFTDHRVDPTLMRRWMEIERRAGDMRFYPTAAAKRFGQAVALCQGTESLRPQQCEKIATNAFAQGIVTTTAQYSSPDAAMLPYKAREARYPATSFSTLGQLERLPARSSAARSDFASFNNAALPRAFAVTATGAAWGWSASNAQSVEQALNACRVMAARKNRNTECVLYAVDDRVVYDHD
jgi:hypothetical protein